MKLYEAIHSIAADRPLREAQNLFVGIECEIESVRNIPSSVEDHWTVTEDHSLRNEGREFISSPIKIPTAVAAFQMLHKSLTLRDKPFSERTSIHVHVNCANLDVDVIKNIMLTYSLYEEVFFKMVNPSRRDNIHCVPISETILPGMFKMDLISLISTWSKYTALNLKPLASYGTIEFRHMHGHNDSELFANWLRTLDLLFEFAQRNKIDENFLSNKDGILAGFKCLTTYFPKTFQDINPMGLLSNSIIDQKLLYL